ncbi:predicted protein [Streptomyces viridochromogenes DSM 40736]|uniref:Predicted protein n=1 Tax=Streptomyces viridochromogenes (strain DSM 40736 / JCM 4977 / BCRC 1201 / Tue 494) TaxID=591159 RepID=D9XDJ1_STRVT|nr:predicted protein [Streptomyces viridochromogenes DSM 40736]
MAGYTSGTRSGRSTATARIRQDPSPSCRAVVQDHTNLGHMPPSRATPLWAGAPSGFTKVTACSCTGEKTPGGTGVHLLRGRRLRASQPPMCPVPDQYVGGP